MNERIRKRSRSRSLHRREHEKRGRSQIEYFNKPSLPLGARSLDKHDLGHYRPMFALYLDIQKRLDIDELAEDEVKGRWKSFVNKWNRAELAEGWYDTNTLYKAKQAQTLPENSTDFQDHETTTGTVNEKRWQMEDPFDEAGDDEFGPALPGTTEVEGRDSSAANLRLGPAVPSLQELQSRNEDARLAAEDAREEQIKNIRLDRKMDRQTQKERLDELIPKAEAGTRDRQLEKRREVAASNRVFASAKEGGGEIDVPESDVMGGDDLSELKRMKNEQERRKTEREIKREEILRARNVEREERSKKMREREEKTMGMLRELARSRFGDGNVQPATLREE